MILLWYHLNGKSKNLLNKKEGQMDGRKCEVEVFSRVTGFFRPVQSWNKGKTEEFKDRMKYNSTKVAEKTCMSCN